MGKAFTSVRQRYLADGGRGYGTKNAGLDAVGCGVRADATLEAGGAHEDLHDDRRRLLKNEWNVFVSANERKY
jgi:hypothetical protein